MEDLENRPEELTPGSSEPTPTGDDEPTLPDKRTEPRGDQERVQEYPSEGVRSHTPTDPATGRADEASGPLGSDEPAGGEGI